MVTSVICSWLAPWGRMYLRKGGSHMKKMKKVGRFFYLLPYIVMPILISLIWHEELRDSFIIAYCLPLAIESWVVILYPICWILTIISFVLCFIECKRNKDKKGILINLGLLGVWILWTIVHVIAIMDFLANFTLVF